MRIQDYVQRMGETLVLDARRRDHVENPLPHFVAAVGTASSPLLKQPLNPSGLRVQHQRRHTGKATAAMMAQLGLPLAPCRRPVLVDRLLKLAPTFHRHDDCPPSVALGSDELLDFALPRASTRSESHHSSRRSAPPRRHVVLTLGQLSRVRLSCGPRLADPPVREPGGHPADRGPSWRGSGPFDMYWRAAR